VAAARWHLLARRAGLGDTWLDEMVAALPPEDRLRAQADADAFPSPRPR
jgi:hypothetical protein